MLKRIVIVALVLAVLGAAGVEGVAWAAKQRSTAKLHGYTGLKANANFETRKINGKTYSRMVVNAKHGMPLNAYNVYVNGKKVGKINTNIAGKGKLDLRSAGMKKTAKSKSMPKWLKTLKKGDVVMVGSSCGVAYKCNHDGTQKYKLEGQGFGENGEHATITYCEKFVNEALDRRFIVSVSNAPPETWYDIWVDGQSVATIVSDFNGMANLEFRTAAFIVEGDSAQPMSDTFPTLQPGTECWVGPIVMYLEQASGGNGGGDGDSSDDDSSSGDDDSNSSDDDSSDDFASDDDSSTSSGDDSSN